MDEVPRGDHLVWMERDEDFSAAQFSITGGEAGGDARPRGTDGLGFSWSIGFALAIN